MIYKVRKFSSNGGGEGSDEDLIKAGVAGAAGVTTMARSTPFIKKSSANHYMKILDSKTEKIKDNKELLKKLKGEARSQGIKVLENVEGFPNSAYLGGYEGRKIRNKIAKLYKKGRRTNNLELIKEADELKKSLSSSGPKEVAKYIGKDAIALGLGSNNSSILAHELGHAQHYNKRSGSLVGKISHKLYGPSNYIVNLANSNNKVERIGVNGIFAGEGFRRGKNSVSTDENGNIKINKKKALKSALIGASVSVPVLISEAAASRKGLKTLKKLGASKELLKSARRDLGNAYGTYLGVSLKPVASEIGGHGLGVAYGIAREKKNKWLSPLLFHT